MPFRYGACAAGGGPWQVARLLTDGSGRELADILAPR
jgi:hypothetical protein